MENENQNELETLNDFKFENQNKFDLLLIKPTNIEHLDFNHPDYTNQLTNLDCYKIITSSSEEYVNTLTENLEINKYKKESLLEVVPQVITEIPNYVYEILYIDELNEQDDKINNIATLLNTNGKNIYGNAILMKTYVPSLSKSILIDNISLNDIKLILDGRVKTNVVIYDGEWSNKVVIGNMEDYARDFFDERFHRLEIPFLLHNINIWYEICEGCSSSLCGNILPKPIYKCIWFTMITDNYRGSLYLSEVEKIIKLSRVLESPFTPKKEWLTEEKDEYGRNVIINKYKILDLAISQLIS